MIKTLLIEDEPQSRDFIKQLARDAAPYIDIAGEAANVDEAVALIKKEQPALVIVDIQLYGRSAFDIFKEIGPFDFQLVFVTAFEHFAIPALKLSAVDYLLKPLSPQEFRQAMEKVRARYNNQLGSYTQTALQAENPAGNGTLIISDYKEINILHYDDVVYFEADGNYSHAVLTSGKKITTAKSISEFEEMLLQHNFSRVHKSYLINLNHITKYVKGRGGEVVMKNGDTVYVSARKKNSFLELLKNQRGG